jgi:hypothetical protein
MSEPKIIGYSNWNEPIYDTPCPECGCEASGPNNWPCWLCAREEQERRLKQRNREEWWLKRPVWLQELRRTWVSPFKVTCPNCESAYTGGHPDPDSITFCVICSDPKTGELRDWIWRWTWLHKKLVSNPNMRAFTEGRRSRD